MRGGGPVASCRVAEAVGVSEVAGVEGVSAVGERDDFVDGGAERVGLWVAGWVDGGAAEPAEGLGGADVGDGSAAWAACALLSGGTVSVHACLCGGDGRGVGGGGVLDT